MAVCLPGFMADTFGNYIAAFLMAGAVGVVGSVIPFTLLCVKQESEHHDIEGTIQDQGQSEEIDKHQLKPRSCSQDSILMIRKDHQRSSSFTTAMESPFY